MWRVWRLAGAVATVLGLSSVAFVYFGMKAAGKPLTFTTAVLAGMPDWYFWAALTPLVFALGVRVPLERTRWMRAAAVHLVAGAAIVLVELAVFTLFNHWFYYNPWAPAPDAIDEAYVKNVLRSFYSAFIIYWLIVAAATAYRYQRDSAAREREAAQLSVRNAELESELARAQLDMLRAQLHPHFLFNALNTVAGLIRERRNEAATDVIAGLGGLLRHALSSVDRDEIPLREELGVLESYLDVERARFRERLRVDFDVEPAALERDVPSLILQPIVENAIRHGIANDPRGGRIRISARTRRNQLELEVRDTGPGFGGSEPRADGARLGLRNTRSRLERLYGARHTFDVANASDGGALVRISIG
ncbi:MAG TPA: histidine kinase [Gemmatimonadaceae bacterium]|nr:histidine kinase [Gemmatimonadaceae bacterium]